MNWLTKFDKSLSLPPIVYTTQYDIGGVYYHPGNYELELEGKLYDATRGIILVDVKDETLVEGTLAHEWRHHWQKHNNGPHPNWPWNPTKNYKESIIKYFQVWHEFDALRFQYKFSKDWCSELWMSWIIENKNSRYNKSFML